MTEVVSVIIPTYNRAHMLSRALASVQAQTFRDIELVVIDDGSTDDTRDVVRNFAGDVGFTVIYHRQENRGCAAARNTGVSLANGDFINFLDSDDALLPAAIQHFMAALQSEEADFVYSPAIEVLESGAETLNRPVAAGRPDEFAVEHFLSTNVRPGAILYTREIIRKSGGQDENLRYNEDSDFLQRVAMVGNPVYSDHPAVRVFHHAGSKSRNRVAIYQALLHSSERTLADHPDFSAKLGPRAHSRLNQIRRQLAEAFIAQGDFASAEDLIQSNGVQVALTKKLSLYFGTRVCRSINRAHRLLDALGLR